MNKKIEPLENVQDAHKLSLAPHQGPLLLWASFANCFLRSMIGSALAVAQFSLWSLRRRAGLTVPVALAFLLLIGAAQTIGTLHDISSVETQQKIAQSWRPPYDLLIRPQSAVSQLERSMGWIDPQSALESYGGISIQQVGNIRSLPHVAQVVPFANIGWQTVNMQVPVELVSRGIYRVSATWVERGAGKTVDDAAVRYVDVTDLTQLTTDTSLDNPIVEHLIANFSPLKRVVKGHCSCRPLRKSIHTTPETVKCKCTKDDVTPVVFSMPVQAIQMVIGVPDSQQKMLSQMLLEGIAPAPAVHLSLRVDRLRGDLNILAACVKRTDCWEAQQVREGRVTYQTGGVQLLRYSRTDYTATPQQLDAGQVSVQSIGEDMQGLLYRVQLAEHVVVPSNAGSGNPREVGVEPLSWPERLPLLTNAVRFIPLEQACAVNGASCYSGLYVRLSGVERYSSSSLALLQATAAAITAHTGLHVDILDGSSLRTVSLATSSANTNQVARFSWRVAGVAVQIVHGLDTLQETLLVLCSMVCLLAIGTAGVLVGLGRRKEALLLQQIGWQRKLLIFTFALDALILCFPGCLLAITWIKLATALRPGSLSPVVVWALLIGGVLVYCCTLVSSACMGSSFFTGRVFGGRGAMPNFVCSLAMTAAIFLIAIEYTLTTNFNQALTLTVLGNQVDEALEVPQVALLLLILVAALLTVGLCTVLLLQGRRQELSLLAMVGWERRKVLLRVMRDSWWSGLVSGEAGALLASGITIVGGAMPPLVIVAGLLVSGPLVGVALASLVTIGPTWQETKRMFSWR